MPFPSRTRRVVTYKTPCNSANLAELNVNHIYWLFNGAGWVWHIPTEPNWISTMFTDPTAALWSCWVPPFPTSILGSLAFSSLGTVSPQPRSLSPLKHPPCPPQVPKVLDPSWFGYTWPLWMKRVRAPDWMSSSMRSRTLVHSLVLCLIFWW